MKRLFVLLTPMLLILGGSKSIELGYASAVSEVEAPLIVELFTSQGCSSCPAADRLLSKLKKTSSKVIPLSFHVSYWNYLGWTDPYSQEAFSKRQRLYARTLHSSVYTPQMVFNGSSECVGSSAAQVDHNIREALETKTTNKIALKLNQQGQSLEVEYQIEGSLDSRSLQIALVESMISVDVSKGENRGRTLKHDNVVRHFKTVALYKGPQGSYKFTLPDDFNSQHGSVVAFIQRSPSMRITGAQQVTL